MSLPYALLGILSYSPMTGYNLGKIFDQSINYTWAASLSQIYRELGVLESKGLVSSIMQAQTGRPDKKVYSITPAGKDSFQGWLTDYPTTFSSPKRDEFSLRLFFGAKLEKQALIDQFRQFIRERVAFGEAMCQGEAMANEMGKTLNADNCDSLRQDQLCWRFIARRALLTNELLISWAKECIQELQEESAKGNQYAAH